MSVFSYRKIKPNCAPGSVLLLRLFTLCFHEINLTKKDKTHGAKDLHEVNNMKNENIHLFIYVDLFSTKAWLI